MIRTLSIARRGIGYGSLAIASLGFISGSAAPVEATRGDITFAMPDFYALDLDQPERPSWNQT